ncbi:hypothetical protein [Maridesulfovibrio ferrireducens]|uniref:hypothetical protein n=1 Tax=Maridesulfovibrio ferrireducens TaxID=246191 RepID=UPI001A292DC5|nr:hypothetical protein [Maridesulfovibrio ferrireducens]MBI9113267.1 hypothetical protein [Maridesulfovibrio ferrireducens]
MRVYLVIVTQCLFFIIIYPAHAKNLHKESWYQERWCKGKDVKEHQLPDRTRVDCLTDSHAIELDFGRKWAESVGQALYYSLQTGKKAGIGLILEKPSDRKYWIRLNSVIEYYKLPIDTWEIKP